MYQTQGGSRQDGNNLSASGFWIPQSPSAQQIRQALTEYGILPLGCPMVKRQTNPVKSILLYGSKCV